jgi:transcriptional regulator with XRE-family HTH domain
MAVTSFGKILRKIRIDRNEVLLDMAAKLNVTASFLSAVENGKRNVPATWLDTLPATYSLSEQSADELRQAAMAQVRFVKLELDKANAKRDEVVFAFARKIEELDDTVLEELKKILTKKEGTE